MTLYYITAYYWDANEWWRFAVSAADQDAAIAKFTEGYGDMRFSRINVRSICSTNDDVFMEI